MNLKPDETVLEIGSGTGIMTCLLSEKVKKVFAVEVERNVLKTLKENISANINSYLSVVCPNVEAL